MTASAPSTDLHAVYLDYLGRTGRGNHAYYRAARVFFRRWPDPQQWAAEPLDVRLSAGASTRPVITFLMLHRVLRPGYDYLLERKLSSIWREIGDSPLGPDLAAFMTAAADLGFTLQVRFATGSQVPARLLIQTGRRLDQLTVADLAAFTQACKDRQERTGKDHQNRAAGGAAFLGPASRRTCAARTTRTAGRTGSGVAAVRFLGVDPGQGPRPGRAWARRYSLRAVSRPVIRWSSGRVLGPCRPGPHPFRARLHHMKSLRSLTVPAELGGDHSR